jgi:CheY-like chemotaxis protein
VPARILVIEDNPESLELIAYLLEAYGHTVLKATDGEEGLQIALREKFDLIICDLQMPKLDGFEVIGRIRASVDIANTPVVAITAYAMREDLERVMAAGFNGYITKPIAPEDFVSQTEQFLKRDLRSNGLSPT